MKSIFIIPIRAYQYFISPILGKNCRHVPTCSEYTIRAIKEWGIFQGIWLGIKRILKCHPWGTFGYDPVPSKRGFYDKTDNIEESNVMQLQFEKRGGLLPVVVQENSTDQVLMLAYADRHAFQETLASGLATFYSTSRNEIWTKGKTSGNTLLIDKILIDCDQDAIIYKVTLSGGGVCHTFSESGEHRKACFYRELDNHGGLSFLPNMK